MEWIFLQETNKEPGCKPRLSVYRLLPYTASTRLFREICGTSLMGGGCCRPSVEIWLLQHFPTWLCLSRTLKNNQTHLSLLRFHLELLSMFVQLDVRPARILKPGCWWTCGVLAEKGLTWRFHKRSTTRSTSSTGHNWTNTKQNTYPVLSSWSCLYVHGVFFKPSFGSGSELRFPTTNCIPLIQMLAFDEGDGLRDLYVTRRRNTPPWWRELGNSSTF